jgi:hypothetical protein
VLIDRKSHPKEGTAEWWQAVARSHLRCAEPNDRLVVPAMKREDHIALAAQAQARAFALMRGED